ncbi:MAG: hypothetical protein JW940_37650 [Polyangiaceae bacterium]|nr:hypothetical protein [Polyangiaceae bacterium]
MTSVRCPNCGAPSVPGSPSSGTIVCPFCSTQFAATRPEPTEVAVPSSRSTTRGMGVRSALVAVAMIVAGAATFALARPSPVPHTPGPTSRVQGTSATAASAVAVLNVSAPVPAPPEQPATAKFTFHRVAPGYRSSFYVLGEVENTSPFAIDKPEIITVLLDGDGKEVGTDNGFATKDTLEPGEKSYVSAIISNPPAYSKLKFEVVARRSTFRMPLSENLRLLDMSVTRPYPGQYAFAGKVENGGRKAARFLEVEVFAFDGQSKLLGVARSYAKTERLEPGQAARYQVTAVGYPQEPARFETTVTGRSVD